MRAVARAVTLTLMLGSVACLAALHVLRSDLDPVARRLSEYANGPYSFLMTAVFSATGLALVSLGALLAGSASVGAWRLVAALLGLAGAGLVLSGIFRTGTESVWVEIVHSRASGLAVLALSAAAVVWALHPTFSGVRRWETATRLLTAIAVAAVATSPILHDTRWSGISQRVVWGSLAAWLLVTAWHCPPTADERMRQRGRPAHIIPA